MLSFIQQAVFAKPMRGREMIGGNFPASYRIHVIHDVPFSLLRNHNILGVVESSVYPLHILALHFYVLRPNELLINLTSWVYRHCLNEANVPGAFVVGQLVLSELLEFFSRDRLPIF